MWLPKLSTESVLFAAVLLILLSQAPAYAVKQSYIVYLGSHTHGSDISNADVSNTDLDRVAETHHQFLASFLGSYEKAKDAIFYSYKKQINGFAANLEEEAAAEIAKHPDVISVFLNHANELHTTRTWQFLGLEQNGVVHHSSLWNKARYGEDTILGNLDTGVWPELESFSDEGYGPVPSRWKGSCKNETAKHSVTCNRKLIGARYFADGYLQAGGEITPGNLTARDHEGHGTHTLTTAAGNFVAGASVFGLGNGTAKGGSARARVATYKVCWPRTDKVGECYDSDSLSAFDAAIDDGVDVISMSVGGDPRDYFDDGIAIGSFHAVKKGIVVVCSAGNSGPLPGTVTNNAPWIFTVAASTFDREFQSFVTLGNGQHFKGSSLSQPLQDPKLYQLISAAEANYANVSSDESIFCKEGTLDPEKVKGKILVCLRGDNARIDKGIQAAAAGAAGMILCNSASEGNEVIADPHLLPASHLNYTAGLAVFSYLNSTKDPRGTLEGPLIKLNSKPAPVMAAFSSQGPNTVNPEILKPDITAPGVNVIAGWSEGVSPTGVPSDARRTPFFIESGTSMSCPHVAGVVGLLRTLYPDWSPAAIRSAIMTTARTRDNTLHSIVNATSVKATPFNYGAGHIRPNKAMDPGLVYDLTVNDYMDFLCGNGYNQTSLKLFYGDDSYKCPESFNILNFNYPSITVPNLSGKVTVTRKLKNVGSPGVYTAQVHEPYGVSVSVEPSELQFSKAGEEKSYSLTMEAKWASAAQDYVFGEIEWTDNRVHHVRSPIVVAAAAQEY